MTWMIILQVILLGIALSMDAFAVSITDGLIYVDLNKKKTLAIAGTFGFLQALMPLIGYWLIELIVHFIGEANGDKVASIVATVAFDKPTSLIQFWQEKLKGACSLFIASSDRIINFPCPFGRGVPLITISYKLGTFIPFDKNFFESSLILL